MTHPPPVRPTGTMVETLGSPFLERLILLLMVMLVLVRVAPALGRCHHTGFAPPRRRAQDCCIGGGFVYTVKMRRGDRYWPLTASAGRSLATATPTESGRRLCMEITSPIEEGLNEQANAREPTLAAVVGQCVHRREARCSSTMGAGYSIQYPRRMSSTRSYDAKRSNWRERAQLSKRGQTIATSGAKTRAILQSQSESSHPTWTDGGRRLFIRAAVVAVTSSLLVAAHGPTAAATEGAPIAAPDASSKGPGESKAPTVSSTSSSLPPSVLNKVKRQERQLQKAATKKKAVSTALEEVRDNSRPGEDAKREDSPIFSAIERLEEQKQIRQQQAAMEGGSKKTTSGSAADGTASTKSLKQFEPINITKVAEENTINVTVLCEEDTYNLFARERNPTACRTVDRTTYTRITTKRGGILLPPWLRPKVVESIPNSELLIAGVVAGSVTEGLRTALLYPLSTIKNRIMAQGKTEDTPPPIEEDEDAEEETNGMGGIASPYFLSPKPPPAFFISFPPPLPLNKHEGQGRALRARAVARETLAMLRQKVRTLSSSFVYHTTQGNLYAGLLPSLLVTVPASGVYTGIRDVTKRMLSGALRTPGKLDDIVVSLVGALVADVASLAVRTPADLLSVRLQVLGGNATVAERYLNDTEDESVDGRGLDRASSDVEAEWGETIGGADGTTVLSKVAKIKGRRVLPPPPSFFDRIMLQDWFRDSLNRLPAIVVCDLPYLLIRIALNYAVTTGTEGLGRYEVETVLVACACAAATTPFDVVQTRIFLARKDVGNDCETEEGSSEENNGGVGTLEDGPRVPPYEGIWNTMRCITREGDGGIANLYAGWIERTAFLGIGRAWLDPIRVIGYLGIRDAVLLQWFE